MNVKNLLTLTLQQVIHCLTRKIHCVIDFGLTKSAQQTVEKNKNEYGG